MGLINYKSFISVAPTLMQSSMWKNSTKNTLYAMDKLSLTIINFKSAFFPLSDPLWWSGQSTTAICLLVVGFQLIVSLKQLQNIYQY